MTSDETPAENLGAAMWKGSSDRLDLDDRPDFARTDLFDAFDANPLGRHELELQLLVSGVRGSVRIPRLVLTRVGVGRWHVVQVAPERGGAASLVTPRVFDDLRAAERFVFGLRLQLLGALGRDDEAAVAPGEGGA